MMSIASNQALITLFLVIPRVAMVSPTNRPAQVDSRLFQVIVGYLDGGVVLPACSLKML